VGVIRNPPALRECRAALNLTWFRRNPHLFIALPFFIPHFHIPHFRAAIKSPPSTLIACPVMYRFFRCQVGG